VATEEHDLEATTGYLVQSDGEGDSGESFSYAMLKAQCDVAGSSGLMSPQGPAVFEIGYWARSAHAGNGYATAAALALAEAGFGQPGIGRVEIHRDVDNPASGRVAAEAGFREVGPIQVQEGAQRLRYSPCVGALPEVAAASGQGEGRDDKLSGAGRPGVGAGRVRRIASCGRGCRAAAVGWRTALVAARVP
jgi:Acetyltransferase (GNAT) domain